jgi:CTP synthase (UTP-ammonia lyase)
MAHKTTIGVIGDFNPENATHLATDRAIEHAATKLGREFDLTWLPTDQSHDLSEFDALFCSPGSPYKNLDGALAGIQFARENNIPFVGTCGGLQHMLLEYARNVMGIRDAAHAETDPYASCLFITPLSCSLVGKTMEVTVQPGSKAAAAYQTPRSLEAYYCNFGLNPTYREPLEQAGLKVTGADQDGEVRIVELPSHNFFLGTLFVPQARSTSANPHPLILEFCRAAMRNERSALSHQLTADG